MYKHAKCYRCNIPSSQFEKTKVKRKSKKKRIRIKHTKRQQHKVLMSRCFI
jgi:hypothetical protein